jgi:DNA-binding NarL/FixJ family response regulator
MPDLNLTPAQQARLDAIHARDRDGKLTSQHYQERPERSNDLTAPELNALHLVADGLTAKQAGVRLGRSEYTVKSHLKSIYRKLEAADAAHAVAIAFRLGLIE